MDTKQKLDALRRKMANSQLAAYLQPVHDEFMNEYPPAAFQRVEWLCGFSGSAGTVAVTEHSAAFFTDGRYVLQAKTEVDSALFEQYNIETKRPETWLAEKLHTGQRVGYDAKLYTRDMVKRMEAAFAKKVITPAATPNLIDALWNNRPRAPHSAVIVHEEKYSGESSGAKRKRIAESIKAAGADAAIIATPDSVCWLLNIRAHDIDHAPLLLSTAIVDTAGRAQLFVDPKRVPREVAAHLGNDVAIAPPETLESALQEKRGVRILCDPQSLPVWYTDTLTAAGAKIVNGQDPCLLPKAMKNTTELKGMKAAHIRDGLAVTKLLCWLDKEKAKITEVDVGEKLLAFRAENPMFKSASFTTIAGSGPHGAVVHYRVTLSSNRVLKKGELFLLDSGGQYPDGTTDITRTLPIGKPSKEHKDRFTRVLKGHIAIALAQFPEGTSGSQLDALARQYLWAAGLDYDHGTGHGVGHFLNVHEGPQRISKRGGDAALRPGMIISNEPGYYKSGAYGIRIENLVAVVESKTKGDRKYFSFETITCAPIDTRLVEKSMLTREERKWLNAYHAWVYKQLSAKLKKPEKAWMAARCKAI